MVCDDRDRCCIVALALMVDGGLTATRSSPRPVQRVDPAQPQPPCSSRVRVRCATRWPIREVELGTPSR
jgi:hypothetical protein